VIDAVKKDWPGFKIDLALSGGRKSMTAMTIFAARNKGIDHVYHTLITDKELYYELYDNLTVRTLESIDNDKERDDWLFLRAHTNRHSQRPLNQCYILFRVPVFLAGEEK
jgi:hypothetical protein